MAVQGRDTLFAVMIDIVYYRKNMQMEQTAVMTAHVTCFFEDNKKYTFYTCWLKKVKGLEAYLLTIQLLREDGEFFDQTQGVLAEKPTRRKKAARWKG